MRRKKKPLGTQVPTSVPPPTSCTPFRVPMEVMLHIFTYSLQLDQAMAHTLLTLNSAIQRALQPLVYVCVELNTSSALVHFSELIRRCPDVARVVRSLWIGPSSARSDLVAILSVPLPGDSSLLARMREEVYTHTRFILRACRRLQDVALSGSLVSSQVVHSYGTACQPLRLTSVNPHSFISGFDAPIFRKVQYLTVCDINLSLNEATAIARLPALRLFAYTSPKDYGDVLRDINVLRRLLAIDDDESLESSLAHLFLQETPHLQFRAVRGRVEKVVAALRNAQQEGNQRMKRMELSEAELPDTFVQEWEALRDLVFNAQGEYSRTALQDDVGSWIDPGHALEQLQREWRQRALA